MRIQVTQVKMSNDGTTHEHITNLYWIEIGNPSNNGWTTRATMVEFVDNTSNEALVISTETVRIKSVHPTGRPAYVRTYRDSTPTDNLLHLPGGSLYGK